jgi:N-acetylmuramoyl-L-alanine amidase
MSYTPQNAPRAASGQISVIVKLREERSAPLVAAVAPGGGGQGGHRDAEALWQRVRQRYPGITIERALQGVNSELVARAQRDAGGPERVGADLNSFYRLKLPANARTGDVVDFVQTGPNREVVESAYVDAGAIPARIEPTNDPLFSRQTYIRGRRGNKRGIYANFAWDRPGGDGANVGVVFVEMGWQLNHEDLSGAGITLISGINGTDPGNREHGTNCVGEVAGQDNALGIVGVAPKARVRVVSTERTAGNHDVAAAIFNGILAMSAGDVMSISLQTASDSANPWPATGFRPLEIHDLNRLVIRVGTLLGRVICTAAGNGNLDLDTVTNANGKFVLRRGHADFRESGAILVGAATETRPHDKVPASNYGSRVDCFAQGQNITTTSMTAAKYVHDFRNTSGATPIVAGAAALLQGMAKARTSSPLSPGQVKSVLAGTSTSVPSRNPTTDRIGRMPNMQLICRYYIDTLRAATPARSKDLESEGAPLYLDPGHGGESSQGQSTPYGGSGVTGIHEKDIALRLARSVRAHYGGMCHLSRDDDYNVSLERRIQDARRSGAKMFVSLHANSGARRNGGPEVWVYGSADAVPDPHSLALAEQISGEIGRSYGRAVPVREGRLTVLDPRLHRDRVAACLVEAGSLADPIDERRLADVRTTDVIGGAVARGVHKYTATYGLASDEIDAEDTQYETPARSHAASAFDDASQEPEQGIQEVGLDYDYAQAYSEIGADSGSSVHADDDAY